MEFVVGILVMIIGLIIWKKEKIGLIHSYHYKNVKDIKGYTAAMGKATLTIGVLIFSVKILKIANVIPENALNIVLSCGIVLIFITIYKIQKKYNGGMF